jgi:hypothetical protein
MTKKQLNSRVSPEVIIMRDELLAHFNKDLPIGKVNANDVLELAIKELHQKYIGKSPSSKTAKKYGLK